LSQRQKNKMLGVWLSREDHDKLEQFVGQFAVDENARADGDRQKDRQTDRQKS